MLFQKQALRDENKLLQVEYGMGRVFPNFRAIHDRVAAHSAQRRELPDRLDEAVHFRLIRCPTQGSLEHLVDARGG